jgi:hypothetical protein
VALEGSAAAAVAGGDMSRGASLLNEVDALRQRTGITREIFERRIYEETLRRVQASGEDDATTTT